MEFHSIQFISMKKFHLIDHFHFEDFPTLFSFDHENDDLRTIERDHFISIKWKKNKIIYGSNLKIVLKEEKSNEIVEDQLNESSMRLFFESSSSE